MALIILFLLWISIQTFVAAATLTLCKKKKATTPAPGSSAAAGSGAPAPPPLDLDKTQDPTAEHPAATDAATNKAATAPDGGTSKTGNADKPKTEPRMAEEPDLKSRPKDPPPAAAPAPAEDVKPMSTMLQAGNDNKFVSKGNGVFVDKDGNAISQIALPPQKDDAPVG